MYYIYIIGINFLKKNQENDWHYRESLKLISRNSFRVEFDKIEINLEDILKKISLPSY